MAEHYIQPRSSGDAARRGDPRATQSDDPRAHRAPRKRSLRHDSESGKDGILLEAPRARFGRHEDLKRILFESGERKLVEQTSRDRC
jgi:predicted NAD-dependent protein-ADP-ribosyltransferase YbiA (DUF1768 family)